MTGTSHGERKREGTEKAFGEIMAEKFPSLTKVTINPQAQKKFTETQAQELRRGIKLCEDTP